jgi:hypothetical protein
MCLALRGPTAIELFSKSAHLSMKRRWGGGFPETASRRLTPTAHQIAVGRDASPPHESVLVLDIAAEMGLQRPGYRAPYWQERSRRRSEHVRTALKPNLARTPTRSTMDCRRKECSTLGDEDNGDSASRLSRRSPGSSLRGRLGHGRRCGHWRRLRRLRKRLRWLARLVGGRWGPSSR